MRIKVRDEKLIQAIKKLVGIDIDSRDQLWIADTGNHRILAIGANGTLASTLSPPPAPRRRSSMRRGSYTTKRWPSPRKPSP